MTGEPPKKWEPTNTQAALILAGIVVGMLFLFFVVLTPIIAGLVFCWRYILA